jgi:hypothetical protein
MITLHRLAKVEFRKAAKWYRRRSPAAAQRFVLAVDAALNRISGNFHLRREPTRTAAGFG